jgi:hypothetical protein
MRPVHHSILEERVTPDMPGIRQRDRQGSALIYVALLLFAVALTPFMMNADFQWGMGLAFGGLIAVMLMVLTVRAPILGFYILTFAAVVIEQNPLTYPIGTDALYVFSWPTRLEGLPERPIGFFIIFILVVLVAIRMGRREGVALRGGPLLWPLLAFLACVAMGVAHGLATGGQFRIIVLEVRPFWYLFTTYLIAYNLLTEKRHIMGFLWILVLGTFVKALQGCFIVITQLHGQINGPTNEIMAHEQSYFFVLILLLTLLCILMKRLNALLWVACASLPFLIIALLANNRRADYMAFVLGAAAVWLLAIAVDVRRRKALITSFIICGAVVSMYILIFGSVHTPISAPANAIISVIQPSKADVRDLQSNLYRVFEDADLQFTEKQSPILGYGFGKPFLEPDPLPNIAFADPYYLYIPHNNILWIWMRLGPLGYLAFWYVVSAAIVRGGVILKRLRDPDLQVVAIFAIGAIIMEIPLAYGDYQIYFYRNIFMTGLLMGILMRLPAIDAKETSAEASGGDEAGEAESRTGRRAPAASEPAHVLAGVAPSHREEAQRELVGASLAAQAPPAAIPRLRQQYRAQMWDS